MKRTAIVIPVRNEEPTIGNILQTLQSYTDLEIIVVDDASTDDSRNVARQQGATVLPLVVGIGAWGAIQTGMRYALKRGFRRVITMDGDGQHHCHEIRKLLAASGSSTECDVVIGACVERGSRLRRWAWSLFRRLTGVGIEDITSGFRIYNLRALQVLVRKQATLLEFQDVGVLMLLRQSGLSICETPVDMSPRAFGKSHIFYSWFAVIYYMVMTSILSVSKGKPFAVRKVRQVGM